MSHSAVRLSLNRDFSSGINVLMINSSFLLEDHDMGLPLKERTQINRSIDALRKVELKRVGAFAYELGASDGIRLIGFLYAAL
jgi:hypothetical protein